MDYSTALCDRNGDVIAQGLTLAVQLGAFPDVMKHITADTETEPGDVFITNDPYGYGGQHLPDIFVVKPIFVDNSLEGYAATMAHHVDVGGIVPGSMAIHATEIYQEGLRIPLLKLYKAGQADQALFKIIEKNTRQPIQVIGDLRAQLTACRSGEKGMVDLFARYDHGTLEEYFEELQDEGERIMRRAINQIPDGTYCFTDYLDGIGDDPEPIQIKVAVEVNEDNITIDFSGTAEQVQAAINAPVGIVRSGCYCAIRCMVREEIPNCQGYMRPVRVKAPIGTIVNPTLPAACAARGVIGYRVFDAVMGALAQAVPERVIAGCEGGPSLFSVGGYHNGLAFVLTEVMVGTWGARASKDGAEGISNPVANLSNSPIELIEVEFPLKITAYGMIRDSGGPGQFRGGLAFIREFEFLSEEIEFTLRADRRNHPPYGLNGGAPGASSDNLLVTGSGEKRLPTMPLSSVKARKGDIFRLVSAGGGGFGRAIERDPHKVLSDVMADKVSIEAARDQYGVIIDRGSMMVNHKDTAKLRLCLAG